MESKYFFDRMAFFKLLVMIPICSSVYFSVSMIKKMLCGLSENYFLANNERLGQKLCIYKLYCSPQTVWMGIMHNLALLFFCLFAFSTYFRLINHVEYPLLFPAPHRLTVCFQETKRIILNCTEQSETLKSSIWRLLTYTSLTKKLNSKKQSCTLLLAFWNFGRSGKWSKSGASFRSRLYTLNPVCKCIEPDTENNSEGNSEL